MSVSRLGTRSRPNEYNWPGFVDVLASLLMVFVFVLMVFVLIQANLAYRVSGQNASLSALRSELSTLSELLNQEREASAELSVTLATTNQQLSLAESKIGELSAALEASETTAASQLEQLRALNAQLLAQTNRADELQANLASATGRIATIEDALAALRLEASSLEEDRAKLSDALASRSIELTARQSQLDQTEDALATSRAEAASQKALNEEAQLEIERLIAATLTLRNELNELRALLAEKEAQSLADKVTIASLGKSLNAALASRVQELQKFKSDFFGRLRDILGARSDVTVVGDRFIFQSEVLFEQGQARLGEAGRAQLTEIGAALMEISNEIPADIPWVLQVDGHTDDVPVSGVYRDNWQLSTERALSVVRYLIQQGVPAERLAATGYGEFQPIAKGTSIDARSRNRRIELKFTQRLQQE